MAINRTGSDVEEILEQLVVRSPTLTVSSTNGIARRIVKGAYFLQLKDVDLSEAINLRDSFLLQAVIDNKITDYIFTEEGTYQPIHSFKLTLRQGTFSAQDILRQKGMAWLALLLNKELLNHQIRENFGSKPALTTLSSQQLIDQPASFHLHRLYASERQVLSEKLIIGHFYMLLAALEAAILKKDKLRGYAKSGDIKLAVESLDKMILTNPEKTFSLESTSRELGISVSKLQRIIKSQHHRSFAEQVRYVKLTMAHRWILSGKLSVSEAAYRIGYTNLSHFARIYRRRFGYLPKETGRR